MMLRSPREAFDFVVEHMADEVREYVVEHLTDDEITDLVERFNERPER